MTNTHDADEDLDRLRARCAELEQQNADLSNALVATQSLTGILSACASCKKIRDGDQWVPLEDFLRARFDIDFSHSLCPTCAPEFGYAKD